MIPPTVEGVAMGDIDWLRAADFGHYDGVPLTEWLPDGRRMRMRAPFVFIHPDGGRWNVPDGAVVDGASIPRAFWTLIGGPFEGRYRDASIVHDHHCDTKSRPWRATHRMFHQAMRCSGVDAVKARVMFAAVYRFGPKWRVGGGPVPESAAPELTPEHANAFAARVERLPNDDGDPAAIERALDAIE